MTQPLVSIFTPVYNGEKYLRPCIESVISQSYRNWEYVIVNNGSADNSLSVAQEYAAQDSRIHVYDNPQFLQVVDNFNAAISHLSADSEYCKPLMADDWLMSECLESLVAAAQGDRSVGLVCCYAFNGEQVLWQGLPYSGAAGQKTGYWDGRDVARFCLMRGTYIFGTPTTHLLRCDLVRKRAPFYDRNNLHADHESCYSLIRESNVAFVHQVLAFHRVHQHSQTTRAVKMESLILGELTALLKYGPYFLNKSEYEQRCSEQFRWYYRVLAKNALRLRRPDFWAFHKERLLQIGRRLEKGKLVWAILRELTCWVVKPMSAVMYIRGWLSRRGAA